MRSRTFMGSNKGNLGWAMEKKVSIRSLARLKPSAGQCKASPRCDVLIGELNVRLGGLRRPDSPVFFLPHVALTES